LQQGTQQSNSLAVMGTAAKAFGNAVISSEKGFGEDIAGAILPYTATGKNYEKTLQ
jgi:hypothetical protein